MQRRQTWLGCALVVCVLAVLAEQQSPVEGCAPAPHQGQWVDIRDESALIIWDSVTKTEHFIRRASFETTADDFGFLVLTPSQPDLGEADDRVFESLGSRTSPRHVYEDQIKTVLGFGPWPNRRPGAAATAGAIPNAAVEVLDQKQVAGFDAAVLRADDAQALAEWLDKHGYEARPALTEWLKWYVENKWIITAFKMTRGERPTFEAKSVHMTFQTDKPFYPYREPEDMRSLDGQGSRALRVFVLSDQRYEGTLGNSGSWPAETPFANDVSDSTRWITSHLQLGETEFSKTLERATYLTEFEDRSFPRPGTDEVYFRPSTDQSTKERPPIVHTRTVFKYWPGPLPGWLSAQVVDALKVAIPVVVVLAIYWRLRRRVISRFRTANQNQPVCVDAED